MVNKRLVAALNHRMESIKDIIDSKLEGFDIKAMEVRYNECMTIKRCIEQNKFDLL